MLKSPWASNQTTPGRGSSRPATTPIAAKQLPDRITGKAPSARAALTRVETWAMRSKLVSISLLKSPVNSRISVSTLAPRERSASSAPRSSRCSGPRPTPKLRRASS